MKVEIDREADVLYVRWGQSGKPPRSREVAKGVFLELDEKGEPMGVEVLFLSTRCTEEGLSHLDITLPAAPPTA